MNQTSIMIDNFSLNLLERIKHGDLIYSAVGSNRESLQEFERLANALFDFEAAGLIEIQSKQSEVSRGEEFISFIAVSHLTAVGEQELAKEIGFYH